MIDDARHRLGAHFAFSPRRMAGVYRRLLIPTPAAARAMEALGLAITDRYAAGIRSDIPWWRKLRPSRRFARRAHNRKLKRG
jgi:hypothetical protein